MTQYRSPLAAGRFIADPAVPELGSRFEFQFSGPAATPAARRLGLPAMDYQGWAHRRYMPSESDDNYGDALLHEGHPHEGHSHQPQYHDADYRDEDYAADNYSGESYRETPYGDANYEAGQYEHGHYEGGGHYGGYSEGYVEGYAEEPYFDESFDPWAEQQPDAHTSDEADDADTTGVRHRRTGAHRLPAPPSALKGRAAVLAVAAGAVVAAGQCALESTGGEHSATNTAELDTAAIASGTGTTAETISATHSKGPQVLTVAEPLQSSQYNEILQTGRQFAKQRAAHEAALLRPQYVRFANGTFTSGFGVRWGAMHAGVDIAAPIGTPIYAVADGTVISAGPASGFGMWVRLLHNDGTITVYGHVNTATVSVGQHVMAGDQIATVGNRGYSTGPHCHFEVWQGGVDKIDPLPWLAARGISLGPQRD